MMKPSIAVLAALLTCALAQTCTVSISPAAVGASVFCSCGRPPTVVEWAISVNVASSCVTDCVSKRVKKIQAACESRSTKKLEKAVSKAMKKCCPKCGGVVGDKQCTRIILEGRPLPFQPPTGCVSKYRATTEGGSFACRCSDGRDLETDYFVASGIKTGEFDSDDCIRNCAVKGLNKICTEKKVADLFEKDSDKLFRKCCIKKCGGIVLDGTSTTSLMCAPSN